MTVSPSGPGDSSLTKWLQVAVITSSALVLVSWLLIALVHLDDTYNIDHVAGTWLALARYVNHGVVYPPLYDGSSFGGTRDMPLQFVLHAGLAGVTGEYLVSGKLLSYAGAAALYGLVFFVCRELSGSRVIALGLVAAVLSTGTGFFDATTVRGDTLPVALQLAAVTLVARRRSRMATPSAGVLCALALLSKLSAVWAAIAILIWLAIHDRRQLAVFCFSFGACSAGMLAIFEVASKGRMSDNLLHLAGAGGRAPLIDTLTKLLSTGEQSAGAIWILVPLAIVGVGAALAHRRITIYHVSFVLALAILFAVLTDIGAKANHLIDVEVLTAVVVADASRVAVTRSAALIQPLVLAAIIWGTLTSYYFNGRSDTGTALRALVGKDGGYDVRPLADALKPNDRILSEDPYVDVSRNEDPVVLDPFMLVRIAHDHPAWQAAFIRQIAAHRFTKIVLERQLNPPGWWWHTYSFGTPIAMAIGRTYRLINVPGDYRSTGRYFVYAPR